jgi:polyhydroxybutyrate depolymerase
MRNFWRWLLLVSMVWGHGVKADTAPPALAPGDYAYTLAHGGRMRRYLLHVPPQALAGHALPVVLNLHGGGGHAANQKTYSRMDTTSDQEGFLAVYPNGTGPQGDRLLTWNAGLCCGSAVVEQVDDVGFILAVLDHLARQTPVDRRRVYATGLSNGAMMSYRLAVEAADAIAAIAPVAGAMMMVRFAPARPVPVMHIHSVDDPRALYEGGLGPPWPMTNTRVRHFSVEQTLGKWITFNQCEAKPEVFPTLQGQGDDSGQTATKYVYHARKTGADVILWKLTGAGHVWPGGRRPYLPRLLGPSTGIIDANTEVWRFFAQYALEKEPPAGSEAK